MTGNRCRNCSRMTRIGLLAGCLLAILAIVIFVWPGTRTQQAAAAVLSPQGAAGYQTAEKLLLTIGLANHERLPVQGKLQVELVDADGNTVDQAEKAVDQKEPVVSYRFEFAIPKLSLSTSSAALPARAAEIRDAFE